MSGSKAPDFDAYGLFRATHSHNHTEIFMKPPVTAKKLTTLSMLAVIALALYAVESTLPPIVPIPGIKLGLAPDYEKQLRSYLQGTDNVHATAVAQIPLPAGTGDRRRDCTGD